MKCRECNRKRETQTAKKHGGGSYRRAGRLRDAQICEPCAVELIATNTPGHWMNRGWDIGSLQHALTKFEADRASTGNP